ncbi:MAG: hypothetical protein ACKO38_12610, partial [Planctomycetota bacterium]
MNRSHGQRRRAMQALLLVSVLGIMAFTVFVKFRASARLRDQERQRTECLELAAAKIKAIALLENGKENLAEPLWDRMAALRPNEPLAARNRALGRLLALSKDRSAEAVAAAAVAIEAAKMAEPASWAPLWIEGRLELLKKDLAAAPEQQDAHLSAALRAFA